MFLNFSPIHTHFTMDSPPEKCALASPQILNEWSQCSVFSKPSSSRRTSSKDSTALLSIWEADFPKLKSFYSLLLLVKAKNMYQNASGTPLRWFASDTAHIHPYNICGEVIAHLYGEGQRFWKMLNGWAVSISLYILVVFQYTFWAFTTSSVLVIRQSPFFVNSTSQMFSSPYKSLNNKMCQLLLWDCLLMKLHNLCVHPNNICDVHFFLVKEFLSW